MAERRRDDASKEMRPAAQRKKAARTAGSTAQRRAKAPAEKPNTGDRTADDASAEYGAERTGQLPGTMLAKLLKDDSDRRAALEGLQRKQRGEQPTAGQVRAVERLVNSRTLEELRILLSALPKKIYREITGRQQTIIDDQARRHNLPLLGPTIDVAALLKRFHDFLAENKYKLAAGETEEELLLSGPDTPALERWREAKAKREEFAYERDLGEWMRRTEMHDHLGRIAGMYRRAAEVLQRQYGRDAARIIEEVCDDAQRQIDHSFGPVGGDDVGSQTD